MAATRTIRSLLVALGVKADDAALKRFDAGMDKVKSGMFSLVTAAAAVTAALVGVTVSASDAGDAAAKSAAKIGITAEEYQELSYAMERSGATSEALEAAMRRQARVMEDARGGSKEAAAALSALGIQAADPRLKNQVALFEAVTTALQGVGDEQRKVALVQEIWGRGGTELIPLVNDMTAGIAGLRAEARALGLVMSTEATAAAEEFNDRLGDAKGILLGLRNTIGVSLMPVFNELLTGFRDWYVVNRQVIQQRIEEWTTDLGDKIKTAARVVNLIVLAMGGWERVIMGVVVALGALAIAWAGFKIGTVVVGAFQAAAAAVAFLGSTAGIVVTAIVLGALQVIAVWTAVILLWEDLLTYFRGGTSAIGEFIERNREAQTVLGAVARLLEAWLTLLGDIGGKVKAAAIAVSDFASALWDAYFPAEKLLSVLGSIGRIAQAGLIGEIERMTATVGLVGRIFGPGVPQASAVAAGPTTNNSLSSNVSVSGVGMSAEEAAALIRRTLETVNREAAAAFAGSDV